MDKVKTVKKQGVVGAKRPPGLLRTPGRTLKAEPVFMDVTSMASLLRPTLPHPGSSSSVWVELVPYNHSMNFMQLHPDIEPRMRSVIMDWMIKASEAFLLQRHTFYMAQDYFDRFMFTRYDVQMETLQLIGATCLLLASKMEESRSLKLSQLVYVAHGAYTEQNLRHMELLILKSLRWRLGCDTSLFWLELYLQLVLMDADPSKLYFPVDMFLQMTRLLDLCTLHVTSLDFEYRVLAAAVLSHYIKRETVERVSGLAGNLIQSCVTWMTPFAASAKLFGEAKLKNFTDMHSEERHNIQAHADYMSMLARADLWR